MKYTPFGRTGVTVSPLILGCMNFGGRTSEEDGLQIIDRALDAGINFLDTANVYGHEPDNYNIGRGRSEQIVGRALQASSKRNKIFLATKVHYPMSDDPNDKGNSRRHIVQQCEASLKRLNLEYIDLYQLHACDPAVPIEQTLQALDDLVRRGLVRYIGTSGFPAWRMVEALAVAKELGLNRFVSEQPPYHLLDRRIERQLIPMAQTYGLAIIPWSPLAGGFLSGKYRPDEPIPAGSRFDQFWKGFGADHYQNRTFEIIRGLQEIADEKECTLAQLAIAWQLHQPAITAPIIGPRTTEQLESALGALKVKLTADELARIDTIAPPNSFTVPYYGGDYQLWSGWKASTPSF